MAKAIKSGDVMGDGRIPGDTAGWIHRPDKFRKGPAGYVTWAISSGSNRLYPEAAPDDSRRPELCGHTSGRGAE